MSSPFDQLRIDPAHLQDLADKQGGTATQIASAAPVTQGVAASVATSHGNICAPTSEAAARAEQARADACAAMEFMSTSLQESLLGAIAWYSRTDSESWDELDGRMRPAP
uniref:ESX-1 secretion-associated protein n=1 Tax=Mycobacterium sp. (strain JLS) TaxID=164757 RepID=A0A5Q5CAZ7_MYCSJ